MHGAGLRPLAFVFLRLGFSRERQQKRGTYAEARGGISEGRQERGAMKTGATSSYLCRERACVTKT